MDTKIEKIIAELYEIDPALKERGADVRALVRTLLESKPHVVISEHFVLNLRKSLLNRASQRVSTPTSSESMSSISWWFFRLAPLPAIAVLILALLPEPSVSPTPYIQQSDMYEMSAPAMDTVQMNSSDATDAGGTNQMFKASSPQTAPMTAQEIQNPLMLESITLQHAGFAVVQTVTGEIVGMSKLLPAGTTVGVSINLHRTPSVGETFTTVLYTDNGDRIFTIDDLRLHSI